MNSTTLRGIFPEPIVDNNKLTEPVYKRNFIKENVKHIKQMQGILQDNQIFESASQWDEKFRNKPMKGVTTQHAIKLSKSQSRSLPASKTKMRLPKYNTHKKRSPGAEKGKRELVLPLKPRSITSSEPLEKSSHRAVQTDTPDGIKKLYESGTIKYPSPSVVKAIATKKISPRRKEISSPNPGQEHGDAGGIIVSNPHNEELADGMQRLEMNDKHDFIKENIMALQKQASKRDSQENTKAPAYQKGVLPKYLRDRREEIKKELEADPECPDGHVLLPEEERKETLRVLRQSYADRIQELNSMPVRNDTLRMRKRKMAIEEELKKIDEGIKVFQRPKVFVKINA